MTQPFGFGFDTVDATHKPRGKIELECSRCGVTQDVEILQRQSRAHQADIDPDDPRNYAAVCRTCGPAQAMAWDREWMETRAKKLDDNS